MKLYISADIEGVTGSTHWDETEKDKADYLEFREQMTAEVNAACEGAIEAGASEIWVKDAHGTGRNLIAAKLPRTVKLIRGWSGHPFWMMQELDHSFQASLLIGYHSGAGSRSNPMSHTLNGKSVYIKINDTLSTECLMNTYTSEFNGVPMVFLSGDEGLCIEVATLNPAIETCAVKQGIGHSTINLNPKLAVERIKEGVKKALGQDITRCHIKLPDSFQTEIKFKDQTQAYRASFYPGNELIDSTTIRFSTKSYFDVLCMLRFVL
jgi:D-amino peptidase